MKVILVSNTAGLLRSFYLPVLRALRGTGAEVVVATPQDDDAQVLIREGFRHAPLPITRALRFPARDLMAFVEILRLYRRERPDLVHHFTAKPIVLGSLAAKLVGIPCRMATFAGLGYVFAKASWLARVGQWLMLRIYRIVLDGRNSWVVFANPDDRELLLHHSVVANDRAVVVLSFGVDTRAFPFTPLPAGTPVVLCAARLLWDKGVGDFAAAAKLLRTRGVRARFLLAGWRDAAHPVAIPEAVLNAWQREGIVEYIGHCHDMVRLLKQSTIVVLPSKYREGVPQILIEAASIGRPVIATDVPGCREACVDGHNGRVVKPGDPEGLAEAMNQLLSNRRETEEMARRGRELAEGRFNLDRIVAETLRAYAAATPA